MCRERAEHTRLLISLDDAAEERLLVDRGNRLGLRFSRDLERITLLRAGVEQGIAAQDVREERECVRDTMEDTAVVVGEDTI